MGSLEETESVSLEALAGTTIIVAGRAIHVGKFSVNQWLTLGRLATGAADKLSADDARTLQRVQAGDTSAAQLGDMARWITATLDPDVIGEAFQLVTKQPAEWCLDNFDIDTVTDLLAAIKQHNNPTRLMALFRPTKEAETSLLPSPVTANGQHAT